MSLFFSSYASQQSMGEVLVVLWSSSDLLTRFDFFFLPILMAIFVYRLDRASYMALIGLCIYNVFTNYLSWKQFSTQVPFTMMLLVNLFSVVLVAYLLMPQVRAYFFDARLRWWESKPRYLVQVPARIRIAGSEPIFSPLRDLALGGTAVDFPDETLAIGDTFWMDFTLDRTPISVKGEAVYKIRLAEGGFRYGIRFVEVPLDVVWDLESGISELRKRKLPETRRLSPWKDDFKQWVKGAKQPMAWVPKTPNRPPKTEKKS